MMEEILIFLTILIEAGFVLIKKQLVPSALFIHVSQFSILIMMMSPFPIVDSREEKEKPAAPDTIKPEFITIKSRQEEKFNGENGFTFEPMLAVNGS